MRTYVPVLLEFTVTYYLSLHFVTDVILQGTVCTVLVRGIIILVFIKKNCILREKILMVRISKKNNNSDQLISILGSSSRCLRLLILSVIVISVFYLFVPFHRQVDKVQINSHGSMRRQKQLQPEEKSISNLISTGTPYLIYGTAWKEDETARLVSEAVRTGFRFIDTACQPKHYNEAGVGEGWSLAAKELGLQRSDIFLQTKFTSLSGQDKNRVPYDIHASLEEQVKQSVATSLQNLRTDYIDSLVLHSPMDSLEDTLRVWRVFESFVEEGIVHHLGISNCYDFKMFEELIENTRVKPSFLQNRFYHESHFDVDLRRLCRERSITYQSFWTLTANRHALKTEQVRNMAHQKNLTPQTLMYAYMMTLGHTPLSGTTSSHHMVEDVAIMKRIQGGKIILNDDEIFFLTNMLGIPTTEED